MEARKAVDRWNCIAVAVHQSRSGHLCTPGRSTNGWPAEIATSPSKSISAYLLCSSSQELTLSTTDHEPTLPDESRVWQVTSIDPQIIRLPRIVTDQLSSGLVCVGKVVSPQKRVNCQPTYHASSASPTHVTKSRTWSLDRLVRTLQCSSGWAIGISRQFIHFSCWVGRLSVAMVRSRRPRIAVQVSPATAPIAADASNTPPKLARAPAQI